MAVKCAKCGIKVIVWKGEISSDYGTKGVVVLECGCRVFARIGHQTIGTIKDTQVSFSMEP